MRRKKCMTRGCKNTDILARGLCGSCYQSLNRLFRLGRITVAEAEKRKLCAPARQAKVFEVIASGRK